MNEIKKLGGEGILTEEDLPDLETQRGRVALLMNDGAWHTGIEILSAAGGTEGLRRLRELRDIPGVEIKRRKSEKKRIFEYKMISYEGNEINFVDLFDLL